MFNIFLPVQRRQAAEWEFPIGRFAGLLRISRSARKGPGQPNDMTSHCAVPNQLRLGGLR